MHYINEASFVSHHPEARILGDGKDEVGNTLSGRIARLLDALSMQ